MPHLRLQVPAPDSIWSQWCMPACRCQKHSWWPAHHHQKTNTQITLSGCGAAEICHRLFRDYLAGDGER